MSLRLNVSSPLSSPESTRKSVSSPRSSGSISPRSPFSFEEFASSDNDTKKRSKPPIGFVALVACLSVSVMVTVCTLTRSIVIEQEDGGQALMARNNFYYSSESSSKEKEHSVDEIPRLVWLMSFPNSGTSFTLSLVRHLSAAKVATNYGEHNLNKEKISVPLHPSYSIGPYQTLESMLLSNFPPQSILTKTHCGGRCLYCSPESYVTTVDDFEEECVLTHGVWRASDQQPKDAFSSSDQDKKVMVSGYYNVSMVGGAVHLYRNPFDNMVSRYHLHHKHKVRSSRNEEEWLKRHPRSAEGFARYCAEMDKADARKETNYTGFSLNIKTTLKKVPCHAEFYRYIQWHNLANAVMERNHLPKITIYYEDYYLNMTGVSSLLLQFLNIKYVGDRKEFSWRDYPEYFTEKQRQAVRDLVDLVATPSTRRELEPYFPSLLLGENETNENEPTAITIPE